MSPANRIRSFGRYATAAPTVCAAKPGCQSWISRSPSWMTRWSLNVTVGSTTSSRGNSREARHEALQERDGREAGLERLAALLGGDHGRAAEESVAAGMVEVMVSVDEGRDRLARRLLDRRHEPPRHGRHHQGVHEHVPLVAEDESRVGDAGVARRVDPRRLDVSEDPRPHLEHPALPACRHLVSRHGSPRMRHSFRNLRMTSPALATASTPSRCPPSPSISKYCTCFPSFLKTSIACRE